MQQMVSKATGRKPSPLSCATIIINEENVAIVSNKDGVVLMKIPVELFQEYILGVHNADYGEVELEEGAWWLYVYSSAGALLSGVTGPLPN